MYAITACVSNRTSKDRYGFLATRQLPTFYLHENVQGIVDEKHAETIAREIINPFNNDDLIMHVSAVKV